MNKNVYSAAYPLHDGRYDEDGPEGTKSTRRVKNWMRFYAWKTTDIFILANITTVNFLARGIYVF